MSFAPINCCRAPSIVAVPVISKSLASLITRSPAPRSTLAVIQILPEVDRELTSRSTLPVVDTTSLLNVMLFSVLTIRSPFSMRNVLEELLPKTVLPSPACCSNESRNISFFTVTLLAFSMMIPSNAAIVPTFP